MYIFDRCNIHHYYTQDSPFKYKPSTYTYYLFITYLLPTYYLERSYLPTHYLPTTSHYLPTTELLPNYYLPTTYLLTTYLITKYVKYYAQTWPMHGHRGPWARARVKKRGRKCWVAGGQGRSVGAPFFLPGPGPKALCGHALAMFGRNI
jgi:hypothetical protein